MATKIDSLGSYRGVIADSAVSLSRKTSVPQWVGRLTATQKFVEDKTEIEHYTKQGVLNNEPGWVDWSGFDEEITAYLTLYSFKVKKEISPETETFNVEQLHNATGWQAPDFDSLGNGSLVGKEILFRVDFRSYVNDEGKTIEGNQVVWIDNKDASPQRQLKTLDTDGLKGLMAQVVGYNTAKTAAKAPAKATPAKPSPTPAVKPAAAAASPATPATTASATPSTPASTAAPATATKKPAAPKAAKKAPPAPAPAPASPATTEPAPTGDALPAETTMDDAWNTVCERKGDNEDDVVVEAWTSVVSEVAGDRDQNDLTGADWAKVRDNVLKDLAA